MAKRNFYTILAAGKITDNILPMLKRTFFLLILLCQQLHANANDECINAITLTPGNTCVNTSGTFNGSGISSAPPSCAANASQDVWFRFTATHATMSISLNAVSSLNHGFEIIEGSCSGTVTACVNNNGSGSSESYFNNNFTPGLVYYIRVINASASPGSASFSICVQQFPAPANDLCSGATTLIPGNNCVNTTGTFSGSFPNGGTPSCATAATQDVWYRFTATEPTMSIGLGGVGALNTAFEVFEDSCNGTLFACVNNGGSGSGENYFNNNFVPGKTYYIRVSHNNSSLVTSSFSICVQQFPAPANDLCAGAITLIPGNNCVNTTGTFSGSFPNGAAPSCATAATQDVWYRFTATEPTMSIGLGGVGALNTTFEVFEDSCNGALFACVNNGGSGSGENYFNNNFVPGKTYYIRVSHNNSSLVTSSFSICVQQFPAPANDLCAGAITLIPGNNCVNTTGTFSGSFPNGAAPLCATAATQDVWYRFTATEPTMSIGLGGVGALNTAFEVFEDSCNGTLFACVNNGGSGSGENYFNNNFVPGKTYYIRVSHNNSSLVTSSFSICVQQFPAPANDLCAGAITLIPGNNCVNTTGTFSGSFPNGAAPSCATAATQDVWYRFTATAPTMSIGLGAVGALNTTFEVYEDSCNGTLFACVNNGGSGSGENYFNNNFVPGRTYYIRVSHNNSSLLTSNFTICVQQFPAPANDLCSSATTLTPGNSCVNTTGTFSGSFPNGGTPSCATAATQDVWYRFTATAPTMSIGLGAVGALNTTFEVYEDSCNGTLFACVNNGGSGSGENYFNNNFVPGRTYYIRVSHNNSSLLTSNFTICVQQFPAPANDLCSSATTLTPGNSCVNTTGTFSGSFPNGGTPSCAAAATQDVWYRFTATAPTMSISLGSVSGLNHGFEIYEGSCGGTLFTCVNNNGSGFSESYFSYNFTPGQTYYVRVFHQNASLATSSFTICVQQYPVPANDVCANATILTPGTTCVNTPGSFSGALFTGSVPACATGATQDVWYQFNATAANMTIQLSAVSGLNHGFQLFEGSCSGTLITCMNNFSAGTSESAVFNNLVPGTTYFIRVINAGGLSISNFNICVIGTAPTCTPALSISAPQTTICSGSSLSFTASPVNGGSSPVYQWFVNSTPAGSNSASFSSSSLNNGDTVKCIMNGNAACANSPTATSNILIITVNPVTTPGFTQVAAICSGASFSLPATSNNGINGTWSPAINNTATTTYTFTPAAGQCATTTTMTVTVNSSTTPTFTQVPAICTGGAFTLPTTSNNGISGTWSPAVNNTATTTYTFTPTVAGQCTTTATMTVTVNNGTTPTFTQVPAICTGGTFTLPATSNNGISGTWSPAINNTATTTYTFTPTAGQCAATATMTVTVNNGTTPTFTQVPAICSGGTFGLPATSNNGISGTWSPAINNTTTTTYTFTPTAGQCATSATMTVTVNNATTPVFTQVPAICSGGSFGLPATSNNGISGTWSPAINNTATTTYTFTPTAGQCAATATMTVTVNSATMPTFTQVPAICTGGTFTLPATSNNGISGTWSPAINNTATTTYTFTPTASQCAATTTMTVIVNSTTMPTFTQVPAICAGGTFTLPATSNNGISGTWSPAINNTATTTYTFTPTAGQCAATATMTVSVNTVETGITLSGTTLTAEAQNAGYQWINCAGNSIIPGETSASYTPAVNGSYAAIISINGCSDTTACIAVNTVSLNQDKTEELPYVYPNPFREQLTLQCPASALHATYSIHDIAGRSIIQGSIQGTSQSLQIQALPPGIYFIRISGYNEAIRIIKQ